MITPNDSANSSMPVPAGSSSVASATGQSVSTPAKATLVKRKRKWPYPFIWAIPLISLIGAGLYFRDYLANHGPEITLIFPDASGLRVGESRMLYRGADVGTVNSISLSPDHKKALVKIQLVKSNAVFASEGAKFWIVRPEISENGLSGLGTLFSGPYIAATPGSGEGEVLEIEGLASAPKPAESGIHYTLTARTMGHVSEGSAVSYKGIPVGSVQKVSLSDRADRLNITILVWTRYAPLVRQNTKFWIATGFDVEAGLFSGFHMKLDSLKTLAGGGIAFATPEEDMGGRVKQNAVFPIEEEPDREWPLWSPKISIAPKPVKASKETLPLPKDREKKQDAPRLAE
ncbi:MAG: MCE family protein [Proteobacteria bacterium]|nr:MAG: MCE family protein [Pseudomonadota bacterium]